MAPKNDLEFGQDEESEIVVFVDENDKEHEFEVIDKLTINNNKYLAMIPLESEDEDNVGSDELIIAKENIENNKETLILLEDEVEFAEISKIFAERLSEFFDIVEEDDEDNSCDCGDGCDHCDGCH